MTSEPTKSNLVVWKCGECTNLFLLPDSTVNPSCPRDKKPLVMGTYEITDFLLPQHHRVCHGCGRLTKIIPSKPIECILCGSPRSLNIDHTVPD